MIHLILGEQGSGKTLFMVKCAYDKYIKGKEIYSNIKLKFPYKQIDYKDIIECRLKKCVVIIDEVHLLLPARNSMSKTSRMICDNFLSMARKQEVDIFGTTQTPRKVDIRFREEADYYYFCEKYAKIKNKLIKVMHNQNLKTSIPLYIKLGITKLFTGEMMEYILYANPYFAKYDTYEIVKIRGLK